MMREVLGQRRGRVWLAAVAACIFILWQHIQPPAWSGPVVREQPQHDGVADATPFQVGRWRYQMLDHISERAKVLRVRDYADRWADLAPVDVAIGWQEMSDPAFLSKLEIWQDHRWYVYRWHERGFDEAQIYRHSKNVHIVPTDAAMARRVGALRPNQIVRFEGYLIEATDIATGQVYRSSTQHDDTGASSCQILLLEHLTVEQ